MKYIIVLLTWYSPNVGLYLQELPAGNTLTQCERELRAMSGDWVRDPNGFGFTIECRLNPNPDKPKGQRK